MNIDIAHLVKIARHRCIIPSGIGGLSYREYFNLHGTLPEQAIEDLIEIYEGKALSINKSLSGIKSELADIKSALKAVSYDINDVERAIKEVEL